MITTWQKPIKLQGSNTLYPFAESGIEIQTMSLELQFIMAQQDTGKNFNNVSSYCLHALRKIYQYILGFLCLKLLLNYKCNLLKIIYHYPLQHEISNLEIGYLSTSKNHVYRLIICLKRLLRGVTAENMRVSTTYIISYFQCFDIEETSNLNMGARGVKTNTEDVKNSAEGMKTSAEGVKTSAEGVKTSAEGVKTGAEGVKTNTEGVKTGAEGVKTNTEGVKTNTEGVKTNTEGVKTNTEGVKTNTEGVKTNTEGVKTNTEGVKTNTEGMNDDFLDVKTYTVSTHYYHKLEDIKLIECLWLEKCELNIIRRKNRSHLRNSYTTLFLNSELLDDGFNWEREYDK